MNGPRCYRDVKDLRAMHELLMAGRKANNGTYYIHTGDLSWWLYYPPLQGDFWEHIYLWDDPVQPGKLSGWALIAPDWVAVDVFTRPELKGSLFASDMVDWAEQRALQVARQSKKPTLNVIWVRRDDDILGPHFAERGYRLKRGYVYLSRPLYDPISAAQVPEGFGLRSCKGMPEVAARAKAQYGSFESTAPFERYVERFSRFMHSPVYNPNLDVVAAAQDGQVAAFCIVWIDPVNKVGHFEPVCTHPDYQRKGLGRAVMVEGLRRLQAAGMKTADVVTDEDNFAAIKLYEALGFRLTNQLGTYEKDV